MNHQNTFPSDDIIISEISEAFNTFALGDIEHNVEKKPIAAFILCSCLIDQLACFIFFEPPRPNGWPVYSNEALYKKFITEYLPQYVGLNLYVNLRCKLVHNYTVGKHIKLTSEVAPYENIDMGKNVKVLTAKMMFNELRTVVEKITIELNNPVSIIRKKAIDCYKHENSKVIAKSTTRFRTYLEFEADILVSYFSKNLNGYIKDGNEIWNIMKVDKKEAKTLNEGQFLITVDINNGKETISKQIDDFTEMLNLESPSSVLNRLAPIP